MARLPVPGADDGNWGDILNDYLSQSHNTDGTLKSAAVSGGIGDATSSAKGVVQLAGDLGGTASAPTVPGLATKANATDLSTHASDTTAVHGIADTSALETTTGAQSKVDTHAAASDPHTSYAILVGGKKIFVGPDPGTDTSASADGDLWIVTAA